MAVTLSNKTDTCIETVADETGDIAVDDIMEQDETVQDIPEAEPDDATKSMASATDDVEGSNEITEATADAGAQYEELTVDEPIREISASQVQEKTVKTGDDSVPETSAKKKKNKKDGKQDAKKTSEKSFAELAPTTTMDFEELVGDDGVYGYPEAFPEAGTYKILVDLYHQVVIAYTKDSKGKYTIPVRYMLCSSGANSSQSPTGTFKMKSYRVRYALFNNTTSYAQYWSLITGRIYFHSILYTAKDPSTYTESYKKLGTNVSHGCIRLTVPDARWIWYNVAPESEVEIRKGSKNDEETVAIRKQLVLASYPSKRLDLKSGKAPWTDNWNIADVPQEVEFVQGSQD